MNNLKPLNNNAIIEMLEKEKITAGGIILTKNDPIEVTKARVLSTGPNCIDVKQGDIIIPNWNAANKNELDGNTFFIISELEIIAVLDE